MRLCLLTLTLLNLLLSGGCKTSAVVQATPTPDLQTVDTPNADPTPEPEMPILKEIANYKRSAESRSPQELADHANSLLPKYGFEYDLDLERIITTKIKQHQTKPAKREGDNSPYVKFDLDVTSTSGAKRKLSVTAPAEDVCCCGYYYTPIPVTRITSKDLTLVIDSQEVVISRPKDIPQVQEYILYSGLDNPSKIRSWEVPFETEPYGVSSDGHKLYVSTEIDDLLLEISDSGALKFAPNDAAGIVTAAEDLRKSPPPQVGEILQKSGDFGLMRYILDGNSYILEFPYPCT